MLWEAWMMSNPVYHIPVLLHESIDGLNIQPDGVYVDVTMGGGGHSREILKRLGQDGVLIAFDQDADAKLNLPDDDRLKFVDQNFRYLKNYLKFLGYEKVDGVLADLGVSSHQFDTADRGFSIRYEGGLDMRMDQGAKLSAYQVVNEYEESDLIRVLKDYGELRNARKVARTIVVKRSEGVIDTTSVLMDAIGFLAPPKDRNKFYAQVFQAIRMEVNNEMGVLKDLLMQCGDVIKDGGRLVVISYHSLEDRLVKNYMKKGKFKGEVEKDFFGNALTPFKEVTRKPIIPSEQEIQTNNRARSAKLRIAEKR